MRYSHTFLVQAAHFNSEEQYKVLYRLKDGENVSPLEVLLMLEHMHGHNFMIHVEFAREKFDPSEHWLVDDIRIAKLVQEWDNKNLSVHNDFTKNRWRATTENMATVLCNKLCNIVSPGTEVDVIVHETESIFAHETMLA